MADKEEGGATSMAEDLKKKGKLGKQQPNLSSPSLMAMLISSEALVRFWLLCAAGVSAGAWVVQQNAEMLSWHKDQQAELEAVGSTSTSASRAALDDFLALNGVDGSEGEGAGGGTRGGSSKARGLWNWVYGLFLPETFDSLPLPFMAVLWHAIIVVGLLTLRPVGRKAGQHQRRPSMVNITGIEQEGEGTELIPKDDQQQQQAPLANAGNKSILETMAHSFGLGPLLTAFNLAQTAWQDSLVFCFFFLLTVAARS